jgi:transposase-like protein
VEEVVWSREVERELPTAVRRVCRSAPNPVHCLATALEEAEHLPAMLRKALAHVCRSERPVYSVEALAAAMGCNRRILWQQWSEAAGPTASIRLQDFLHWLLLLRAVGRKVPERSWESVAHDLGVHPHTLGRWAKQLAGRTLRELSTVGTAVVGTMLHYRIMASLLRDDGSDKM